MAQLLAGHDITGSIREFDKDGIYPAGTKMQECIFVNFARLLQKDEIKKGSFNLQLGVSGAFASGGIAGSKTEFQELLTITDDGAATSYLVNSPAGEYAILYATGNTTGANTKVGHLYYQAGIAVLTASVLAGADE